MHALILILSVLQWIPTHSIYYGFAPGTPSYVKKSAHDQLSKWERVAPFHFVFNPKFQHFSDGNGILFCVQGNGEFGTTLFNFTDVSHTEQIIIASQYGEISQCSKIDLNIYLYKYHRGGRYLIPQHGKLQDSYDVDRILLHQIGLALGVPESDDPSAIMYPEPHVGPCQFQLSDIILINQKWFN